jgi:hypothetical protein
MQTTTTHNFVQPFPNSGGVFVSVESIEGFASNQAIEIFPAGFYRIIGLGRPSTMHLSLLCDAPSELAPGRTVRAGAIVRAVSPLPQESL